MVVFSNIWAYFILTLVNNRKKSKQTKKVKKNIRQRNGAWPGIVKSRKKRSFIYLNFEENKRLKMDQMLPSPSFNIPSIGTPHHAMEEDQMIDRSAQATHEQKSQDHHGSKFFSTGMTPHNFLSSGQTPHSLLASPAVHNQVKNR